MGYKFTIFTPTYNRAKLLKELYKSLKLQSYKNFEWLIVDDGSTDNTYEIVREFQLEKIIEIKYIKKENGGKQRAYNLGVENARGELFICLDSDDTYVENALEIILKYWEKYSNDLEIAGMGYLSCYPDGRVIGTEFPKNEMLSNQFEIYYNYKVSGDKGLMFRTKILKNYKFPEIEDEKFITEAVVYNRISKNYKILYINEKIEIKEYHQDGLTNKYAKLLIDNPKGNIIYYNERNYFKMSFKDKLLNNAIYYKFSRISKVKLKEIFNSSNSKFYLFLALPIGEYMYRKIKKNWIKENKWKRF